AAELAHHFGEAAAAGYADRAVLHSVRAAEDAEERTAFTEAAGFYGQALDALDLTQDDHRRAELLLLRARSLEYGGDVEAARRIAGDVATIARAADDAVLLVRAGCRHLGDYGMFAEPGNPEALAIIREGLEGLAPEHVQIRGEGLVGLLRAAIYDADAIDAAQVDEAIDLARRSGSADLVRRAIEGKQWIIQSSGRTDECLALAREAVELSTVTDPSELWASGAYLMLGRALAEAGEMDEARAVLAHTATFKVPGRGWSNANFLAAEAAAAGEWDRSLELSRQAVELGRPILGATVDAISSGLVARIRAFQGDVAAAGPAAEAVGASGIPGGYLEAGLALMTGDREEARRRAREWVELSPALPHFLVAFSYAEIARVAERTMDRELADWLRIEVTPMAGTFLASEPAIQGPADHVLGLAEAAAGDDEAAIPLLERSLAASRERTWHAIVTLNLVDLARALQRRDDAGDAARVGELAREAAAEAERLGMPVTQREAADLLR
ncbi:MAG: hypothetical protein AAGK32_05805, partial [Actinomycetota bacterium]